MPRSKALSLDRLNLFLAVADAHGFTAAAERLDVNKTLLSQQVAKLEAELGGALFTRTTRRVELTEAGQRLYDESAPLLRSLESAVSDFGDAHVEPSGTLRITAPADYAANVLAPALVAFQKKNPKMQVDLIATGELLDMVAERVDLAVRLGWLRDSSMRAVQVGEFSQVVVAAPGYLRAGGTPKKPEQLAEHSWVALSLLRTPLAWRFTSRRGKTTNVRMRSAFRANSQESVLGMVRAGAGISVLADFSAASDLREGTLQLLLPEWSLPRGGIHLVYPQTRQPPGKVRRFIDFFRSWLETQGR